MLAVVCGRDREPLCAHEAQSAGSSDDTNESHSALSKSIVNMKTPKTIIAKTK